MIRRRQELMHRPVVARAITRRDEANPCLEEATEWMNEATERLDEAATRRDEANTCQDDAPDACRAPVAVTR